ncbi:hypothetical protein [Helicobacter turcicus]|uniref:Uncharacterized protein n=1 Tax=Helicobacter turcicus TaxID=2867412 RepID=A0ABS7JNZ4_9HELI|nr:hypothetical protein [Helicobacter turcicus]MBX7491074.1 hypothetical protein [Helicobacter turcicus]
MGGGARFQPYEIAVIDDNVMSLNLFVARPKIKFTPKYPNNRDNLNIFLKFLPPYVKIIFCIGSSIQRLEKADIFLYIEIREELRKNLLFTREKTSRNYADLCAVSSVPILPYEYKIIIDLSKSKII